MENPGSEACHAILSLLTARKDEAKLKDREKKKGSTVTTFS